MRKFKEQGIDKHPSIASEYIKYISHNQPYEAIETMDKKLRDLDEKVKDQISKAASQNKQLNTTT